jgi:two-component system LytT family response regulator
MIKLIIVDDEERFRESLNEMIRDNFQDKLQVVAICGSVKEAVLAIHKYTPDLVFLDIEMPSGNGFQVLEQTTDKSFEVIFTTGFDKYAIKAIQFSALDFLLKPFGLTELTESILRYDQKREKQSTQRQFDVLLHNIKLVSNPHKKIALPTLNGFIVVGLEEIIRCESDNNYTQFYLKDKSKILVCKSLKEYTELLEDSNFFRVHQSHLININFIKKYSRGEGGSVQMTDGSEVEVSRRKKEEFLKRMANSF